MSEINENIDELNRSIQELNMLLINTGTGAQQLNTSSRQASQSVSDFSKKSSQAVMSFNSALLSGVAGVKQISSAALSSADALTFAGKSINAFASTASSITSQFGTLGKGTGFLIQAFSSIVESVLGFGTSALDAKDVISSMGAAGRITSEEFKTMAERAQMFGADSVKYAKIVKGLGSDILALGSSVSDGVNNFSKFTDLTKEQISQYQRLGIGQEELIAGLADYVKLQNQSGQIITREMIVSGKLQKAALEYTDSLVTLAELTGIDIETQKKRQFEVQANYQWQLKNIQLEDRLAKAKESGNKEEIDAIQKEIKGRQEMSLAIGLINDASERAKIISVANTEAYNEQSSSLAQLNFGMMDFVGDMKKGSLDIGKFLDSYFSKMRESAAGSLGQASVYYADELAKRMGFTSTNLAQANAMYNKQITEAIDAERKRTQDVKERAAKPDPLEDARIQFLRVILQLKETLADLSWAIMEKILPNLLDFGNWLEMNIPKIKDKVMKLIDDVSEFVDKFKLGLDDAKIALGVFAAYVSTKLIGGLSAALTGLLARAGLGAGAAVGVGAVASGAAGYAAGTWLNETFGISDWIVDKLMREKEEKAMGPMVMQLPRPAQIPPGTSTAGAGRGDYGMKPIASSEGVEVARNPFYNKMYAILLEEAKRAGVPNPEVIAKLGAAQASLETGYGKSAPNQNYFGIKGAGSTQTTKEFVNGREVTTEASFRKYGSMEESAADYVKFLQTNKRYRDVLGATTLEDAILAQGRTGYATDPKYAQKLASIAGTTVPTSSVSDSPRSFSSLDSALGRFSAELSQKFDIMIDKLNRSLTIQEDILKYTKYKS